MWNQHVNLPATKLGSEALAPFQEWWPEVHVLHYEGACGWQFSDHTPLEREGQGVGFGNWTTKGKNAPLRKNQRCRQPEYSGRILCIRKGSKISLQRRLGRTGRNARSTVERAKSCMASAPRRVRSLGRTGRRTRVRKALPCLLEKSGIHTFLHDLIASFQVNSFGKEDSWIHSTSSKLTYLASTIWRLNMLPTWLSIVHTPDDAGSRADLESGKSRSGCSSGFFGLQTKHRSRIVLQILNFNQSISTERQSADPKNWASNSQSSTLQRRVAEFPHLTQTVFYMD